VRDAQLSQLRAKEVEAADKVRSANERVAATFGNHPGLVDFHLATIAIYGVLLIRARPRSLGS
jgi:hypothetical protein